MTASTWFPALMVFTAVLFGTIALALLWEAVRDGLRRRRAARRLRAMLRPEQMAAARSVELVREEDEAGLVSGLARWIPGVDGIARLMRQSRLDWATETFVLVTLGVGFAAGIAVFLPTTSLALAAAVAAAAGSIPYVYAVQRRNRIMREFEEQLPDAIDLLTRAIRAGHPLAAGMRMVADEAPPVIASEFRQAFEEQRFGLPFEDALLGMVDRVDLVDVRIFAVAVLTQREVGGNLAEILDNLARTIRDRFSVRRQLRVHTAQAKLSGLVLVLLPPSVGLALFLIQPEYILTLFRTQVGLLMVGTALVLQLVGAVWIRRIVDIEI